MPTFRPPSNGVAMSEAIAEAYAVAPENVLIYHTLELRHPSFVDDLGNPTAIRVVRDVVGLVATLELGAPMDPATSVIFQPLMFDFTLPPEGDSSSVPEVTLTLDNVGRLLIQYLDAALESRDSIEVTYRPFLSSDTSGPHIDPPLTLTLRGVSVGLTKVTARASFGDLPNRRFPSKDYSVYDFPTLTAK